MDCFLDIIPIENGSRVVFDWITSGALNSAWSVKVDSLVKVMLVVVLSVSSLVHLYSIGYMRNDHNWNSEEKYKARFFSYLSFFTFAMLVLVSADNLLQLFFGWEGVGVASYLLIGFYFKKPSANNAAMKAFIVNRVGDFGFLIGIFIIFAYAGSIDFSDIFNFFATENQAKLAGFKIEEIICFFLFVGAMGKSAQIFLHTWLPDAMEGPTPVSALIHAATMVTAGVFLTCRFSPLFEAAPQVSKLSFSSRIFDCILCSDYSISTKRYKKNNCIFNLLSAWIHVRSSWCWILSSCNVSSFLPMRFLRLYYFLEQAQ